jgi:hypothetical protein
MGLGSTVAGMAVDTMAGMDMVGTAAAGVAKC